MHPFISFSSKCLCKSPKNHGLAAVVCNWTVDVETVVLHSTKRNSIETSVRCVIVQYEENWIIFSWSSIVHELLKPTDKWF